MEYNDFNQEKFCLAEEPVFSPDPDPVEVWEDKPGKDERPNDNEPPF